MNTTMKISHCKPCKLKQLAIMTGIMLSGIEGICKPIPAQAVTFNYTAAPGTSQAAIDGFEKAGALWSAVLTDNVTVNLDIAFTPLNFRGQSNPTQVSFSYASVYNALDRDRSSIDDRTSVTNLGNAPTFKLLVNRTSDNPNGSGSEIPYLDNNNSTNNNSINMTSANAKALGLLPNINLDSDGSIAFNSNRLWDFDPSDGIDPGATDFVGLSVHEIGHSLGFISGVDSLDFLSSSGIDRPYSEDRFLATTLDLFRYSMLGTSQNAIDLTSDLREKYFSLDSGSTNIALFATGQSFGDGSQASHWKDGLEIGIMRPIFSNGRLFEISQTDLRAFDAIGWDLNANATAVPEPANFVGIFLGVIFGGSIILKQRNKLLKLSVNTEIEVN
jgi:hypothetical protein